MFCLFSAECQYDLEFKCKKKPCGMATIYPAIQLENNQEIRKLEENGYKFNKIFKLTVITYNSIKNINPIFYKNHIPKPMSITNKILQLIDRNPGNFKDWACGLYCKERLGSCDNTDPVSRYVCYKFYS